MGPIANVAKVTASQFAAALVGSWDFPLTADLNVPPAPIVLRTKPVVTKDVPTPALVVVASEPTAQSLTTTLCAAALNDSPAILSLDATR